MSLVIFIYIGDAWACKKREVLDEYPVKEAIPSTTLVVAKVVEIIKRGEEKSRGTDIFRMKVIKTYQGKLVAGDVVTVFSSYGPSHGLCPVYVKKRHKYIMILWYIDNRYQISRFNYLVDSRSKKYTSYIQQLDKLYTK